MSLHKSYEEEKSKRDKTSSDDDSDVEVPDNESAIKHRRRKSTSPSRKAKSEDQQNRNSDRVVRSTSPRRQTSRKMRSESQMTYGRVQSNANDPQPRKVMKALDEIDGYYLYLNRKYRKEIRELTEKCERQEKHINQIENKEWNQRWRLDQAEHRAREFDFARRNLDEQKKKLEKKNKTLEATVERMKRDNEELEKKYVEQVEKEKKTQKKLDRDLKKIEGHQNGPKGWLSSEKEKQLMKDCERHQQAIEEKDKEIRDLKNMLSQLQKKSFSVRDELRLINARNRE